MHWNRTKLFFVSGGVACSLLVTPAHADRGGWFAEGYDHELRVQLGPRPFYLVDQMAESELKQRLRGCSQGPFHRTDFSIGHRGAPLQFPEHTQESYEAAARMGAGILECDVTFTQDSELVCRHSQCDLHTTTNILLTDLASKCSQPFEPAEFDATTGERVKAASAKCCTSDITLEEFRSLKGKMDASDPDATSVEEYLGGTANWRTDLYATSGTLVSHAESIELFSRLGVKFTPELKAVTGVTLPFGAFQTQQDYAQKLIDEYKAAGVPSEKVYAQSFSLDDVRYWIENEPDFGRRAVFLDDRYEEGNHPTLDPADPSTWSPTMEELVARGVSIIAPPMWVLVTLDHRNEIVPSAYAVAARAAGLDIITWTTERSGRIVEDVLEGGNTFYYQTTLDGLSSDGDILTTIDVLARQVGIIGLFSDWPATTTYYANCMLEGDEDA